MERDTQNIQSTGSLPRLVSGVFVALLLCVEFLGARNSQAQGESVIQAMPGAPVPVLSPASVLRSALPFQSVPYTDSGLDHSGSNSAVQSSQRPKQKPHNRHGCGIATGAYNAGEYIVKSYYWTYIVLPTKLIKGVVKVVASPLNSQHQNQAKAQYVGSQNQPSSVH